MSSLEQFPWFRTPHEESDQLRELRMKYETMENDRDAEKQMKATARGQRDKMTKKYRELVELLASSGVLQYDEEWAVEIQDLIKSHKAR